MSKNSLILVLRKENKQNSDMTWQKYKLNLRNSLLWEEYFRIMEQFDSILSSVITSILGLRCIIHRGTLTDTPSSACYSVWRKISILRSVDGFCSKILICKVYFTDMWCHYLISLHGYFIIEMLRMRLYLYPSNLSIVFYQTTAFVEKQVMPLAVGENANRWSRKRQSLLERTPIASRDDVMR